MKLALDIRLIAVLPFLILETQASTLLSIPLTNLEGKPINHLTQKYEICLVGVRREQFYPGLLGPELRERITDYNRSLGAFIYLDRIGLPLYDSEQVFVAEGHASVLKFQIFEGHTHSIGLPEKYIRGHEKPGNRYAEAMQGIVSGASSEMNRKVAAWIKAFALQSLPMEGDSVIKSLRPDDERYTLVDFLSNDGFVLKYINESRDGRFTEYSDAQKLPFFPIISIGAIESRGSGLGHSPTYFAHDVILITSETRFSWQDHLIECLKR